MDITVKIRFYEELNDFLPAKKRKVRFTRQLHHHTSVKDAIESCGVPHPEVDLILVNGKSINFEYLVDDGDDISVYPVFEAFDIKDVTHLQERPLRKLKFIADVHLGGLTGKLRLLGFDVNYDKYATDDNLIGAVKSQRRILLTRKRRLLMHKIIDRGIYIRSIDSPQQALEVIERLNLENKINPFSRCMRCNHQLKVVPKEKILDHLEPKTKKYYFEFYQCSGCEKVFWPGAHFKKLLGFINWIDFMVNISGRKFKSS